MACKLSSLPRSFPSSLHQNPNLIPTSNHCLPLRLFAPSLPPNSCLSASVSAFRRAGFVTACAFRSQEHTGEGESQISDVSEEEKEDEIVRQGEKKELANQGIWSQVKEIVMFTGPATGLWICGPLMSLIDTAIIGQRSSLELAALGPATVVCDYMSYVFMFLSIATSNMVATALAKQDREEVQHHISVLLFIGLACGFGMLLFTRLFGAAILTAFVGPKNVHVVPAATSYVQIRGLAWPALLVGWVAQSASLGMKDSWGPLKALAAASVINCVGCILLCTYLDYGIAGAAFATLTAQVFSAYMMIQTLNMKGYNAFAFTIPSGKELLTIMGLAAPVFLTLMTKVGFYALLIYFATAMGTHTMAAHQVMVQTYCMCTVWGEPLSQTAQSFMPGLIYGANRSLSKARLLLRSLVIIGAILGLLLGIVGTSVPWLFPYIFTPDRMVIQEMHRVLIPYFIALAVTPPTHSLEGTLLVCSFHFLLRTAGRDLRFASLSMSGCFCVGSLVLWILSSRYGLLGGWFSLAIFQWARFSMALQRLLSPKGVLHTADQYKVQKLRTA
ncbi:protein DETOXIFICATION 46, chloroplastic-like isoform X2 [Abrus precatorius]|uniref:Protein DETOXIFICATION n=1 Tax=Abrus precatorius TaxID=3816 RepID=A0A8B8LDX7_ABRPR|nr:protein DETOXIFICATION 46, chloroplastic-like isoform X2 [Abrus precatorius]